MSEEYEANLAKAKANSLEVATYLQSLGVKTPVDPSPHSRGYGYEHSFPEIDYPQLVLVVGDRETYSQYRSLVNWTFAPDQDWYALAHQAGGMNCTQHYYVATMVKIKDKYMDAMHRMTSKHRWCGTDFDLNTIWMYNRYLEEVFEVDCLDSFREFEESIYPIDLGYLGRLTEGFPSFDAPDKTWQTQEYLTSKLLTFTEEEKTFPYRPSFRLMILGENCD